MRARDVTPRHVTLADAAVRSRVNCALRRFHAYTARYENTIIIIIVLQSKAKMHAAKERGSDANLSIMSFVNRAEKMWIS